jgi:hypothetical protein
MTYEEALEIVEIYEMCEEKTCTCIHGSLPCRCCEYFPDGSLYEEALERINKGENDD